MRTRSYPWYWWWIVGAVVCGLLYLVFFIPPVRIYSLRPMAEDRLAGDHYFVLHMPSIASRENFSEERANAWFEGLSREGYQPILLTEVYRRLKAGRPLPRKALVLVFDPGFRTTYEVMQPLLEKYRFPAVWISDKASMDSADRRYVSYHLFEGMKESGVWDIGWYEKDSRLRLQSKTGEIEVGKDNGTWRTGSGRRALNNGWPKGELNRLHSNWNWTSQQLLSRLRAEQPLTGPGQLSFEKIQDYKWGVILPPDSSDVIAELKAPLDGRTVGLSWLGTRGVDDASIDVNVQFYSGEFWLLLRSNEDKSEHIGVCFTGNTLLISQMINQKTSELYSGAVASLERGAALSARVVIRGGDLRVYVQGSEAAHVTNLAPPSSGEGILRLKLYDKILGAAYARSIDLQMRPL